MLLEKKKKNIKNLVLDDINSWTSMVVCEEWMKKGHLKTFWNVVHLEEEEKEEKEERIHYSYHMF